MSREPRERTRRPATRRQPPDQIWVAWLLVGLVSVPLAALGAVLYAGSQDTFHLAVAVVFGLMAIAFTVNGFVLRRHQRRRTGPYRPGNEWGSGLGDDTAPWIT